MNDELLTYHLMCSPKGTWTVFRESHEEPLGDFAERDEALEFARVECRKFGLARLVVHSDHGQVAEVEHFSGEPSTIDG